MLPSGQEAPSMIPVKGIEIAWQKLSRGPHQRKIGCGIFHKKYRTTSQSSSGIYWAELKRPLTLSAINALIDGVLSSFTHRFDVAANALDRCARRNSKRECCQNSNKNRLFHIITFQFDPIVADSTLLSKLGSLNGCLRR